MPITMKKRISNGTAVSLGVISAMRQFVFMMEVRCDEHTGRLLLHRSETQLNSYGAQLGFAQLYSRILFRYEVIQLMTNG